MSDLLNRYRIIEYFFIGFALILIFKAAKLQLIDKGYREKVEKATLRKTLLLPSRGLIYDRTGKLLVNNEPVYELEVIYNDLDKNMDTTKLCQLLNISKEDFIRKINKNWKNYRYSKTSPFIFLSKIDPEVYSRFVEHLYEFPGFYPSIKSVRNYPYNNAAHILGYMGEVNQKTIKKSKGQYSPGDYIGITGLEAVYEKELRGKKGVKFEIKDNFGRSIQSYQNGVFDSSAVAGYKMISSLDIELQAYGEKLMQNKRGAIVAIEPSTGQILALVSSPGYNPNDLSVRSDRGKIFAKLLNDSINKPLLNRAITSKYPPGSIFKPVLGLIALQEGVTYPNRTIYCGGQYVYKTKYNTFRYGCHHHPTPYNIGIAIQHSCNSYFFQLGRDVIEKYGFSNPGRGLDTLVNYLKEFGMGRKLGIDLKNENSGFVPNSKFYDRLYSKQHAKWRSTYIMSLGIGQGELELTTLQMANIAAILANRGYYFTPHLIKEFEPSIPIPEKYTIKHKVRIDSIFFKPVLNGMERAVLSGTAELAYTPGIRICGKTGTSENYTYKDGKRIKLEDHSVFMAFAPRENPKIAIAVFVENGGPGGLLAAPVASLMIEKYIRGEIPFYRQWLENRILKTDLVNKKKKIR